MEDVVIRAAAVVTALATSGLFVLQCLAAFRRPGPRLDGEVRHTADERLVLRLTARNCGDEVVSLDELEVIDPPDVGSFFPARAANGCSPQRRLRLGILLGPCGAGEVRGERGLIQHPDLKKFSVAIAPPQGGCSQLTVRVRATLRGPQLRTRNLWLTRAIPNGRVEKGSHAT
jgi:hypothetical protein